ncbi:hypothetical protein EDC04DRAFT_2731846 [Pisolithus marmoratus]|nr:hypothetical protein EDC04DRAFT_2731846 [Pisolithus marmoratus]
MGIDGRNQGSSTSWVFPRLGMNSRYAVAFGGSLTAALPEFYHFRYAGAQYSEIGPGICGDTRSSAVPPRTASHLESATFWSEHVWFMKNGMPFDCRCQKWTAYVF